MTGLDAFKQALRLLNYTDGNGELDAAASGELYKRGLALTDQIHADLVRVETGKTAPPLASLLCPLKLSNTAAREVMPYGIAMLLAAGRADADNQELFAALYAQKRTLLKRPYERRIDVLPRGCDE